MLKLHSIVWVKNVNNKRNSGRTTSVPLSPFSVQFQNKDQLTNGKLAFIHIVNHTLITFISTHVFVVFCLLSASYTYYPHPLLIEPQMKN